MSVAPFVDVEQLVIVWLTEHLPGVHVSGGMPEGTAGIRVTRSPASGDADTVIGRVDVECFAADRTAMWVLAGRANNALAELPGDVVVLATGEGADAGELEVQVDDVTTVTDPVPGYWSPTVERSVAVYELELRPF